MFIVLEGIDNSGKSTHAKLLVEWLRKELKKQVVLTAEPSKSRLGYYLRQLIEDPEGWKSDEFLAYLFAANRYQHLYCPDGIISQLKQGKIVVCDRYFYSSLVYQDGCLKLVRELNKHFPLPDLSIYLEPNCQDRKLSCLATRYRNLAEFNPDLSCLNTDTYSVEHNQAKIRRFVRQKLECRSSDRYSLVAP